MTSNEFIIKQINNIISLFPYLRVRYEHEYISKTHYLEILPSDSFNNDSDYIDFEKSLRSFFMDFFPLESLCFLTEDSLYEIENPVVDMAGLLYGEKAYLPILDYTKANFQSFTIINQKDFYAGYDYESIMNESSSYNLSSKENKPNFFGKQSYAMAA